MPVYIDREEAIKAVQEITETDYADAEFAISVAECDGTYTDEILDVSYGGFSYYVQRVGSVS